MVPQFSVDIRKLIIYCRDIELLAVRPDYFATEFSRAVVVVVYVPPHADTETACDVIYSAVATLQT